MMLGTGEARDFKDFKRLS